jgi:lipopolysaccharide export system protein LptC
MLRDKLTVYFPVTLMALLAAGTWWLVRHAPRPEVAQTSAQRRHMVDYDMRAFVTERFGVDGSLRAVVNGQMLRHYADTETVEIERMQAFGVDDFGRRYSAWALRGLADAAADHVQLSGEVRVVRDIASARVPASSALAFIRGAVANPGRLEFIGEALVLDARAQRARSVRPITVLSSVGRIQANTLEYNGATGRLVLDGRVHGTYASSTEKESVPSLGR